MSQYSLQRRTIGLVVALAGVPISVRAEAPAGSEPKPLAQSFRERLTFGGFVDAYYAYNDNHPSDGASFIPGTGTTGKRANEFAINLAELEVSATPEPVGFKVVIGFGNSTEVVHLAEVAAPGVGSDVWENVIQASAMYQTQVGRGLAFEGGIYPSHIGFETLLSKDNWNYTRSWMGELSPYYQTGLKISYPFSDRWSGQFHVLNGWQNIGDNNSGKTLGTQLAWTSEKTSVSFNTLAGPELSGNDDDWRLLGDIVLVIRPSVAWSFGASVDVASESRPIGPSVSWWGAAGYARMAPAGKRWALAARVETFDDEDGAISGTAQRLKEATLTFEYRPTDGLIVKIEGRHDRSSAAVFGTDDLDSAGAPMLDEHETLLIAGVVAVF